MAHPRVERADLGVKYAETTAALSEANDRLIAVRACNARVRDAFQGGRS